MVKHRAVRLLMALLVFVAPAAQAFIDPPWITPAAPRAVEMVSVNVRLGICDAFFERPGYPEITQEGNAIHIVEYGHHWENDELCGYGIGTATELIGAFPPGDYTLTFELFYVDEIGFPRILTIGIVPFTVTGVVAAASVPTFNVASLLALLLLLPSLAAWALRTRRAGHLSILLSAFVAPTAHAFIDPPWITPAAPRAGETVSVNIQMGICDAVLEWPGYPQIILEGNAIRVVEYGVHWENDELCGFDVGTTTEPIGAFPPGDYVLTVDFHYVDEIGFPRVLAVGIIPFTVTGVSITHVPTLRPSGLLVLLLLVSALAVRALRTGRAGRLLILLSVFVAQSAHAFFDPPWITPATPRADEVVSVNIRDGICDAIFERQGYPQITRDGNAIRILEYGHHWEDDELCVYDVGTTVDPIGALSPGDYTLTVDFIYENYPFGYTTITLGVVDFTVTGAAPVIPVPIFNVTGLLALLLLTPGLAIWVLRKQRRTRT